MWMFSFDSINVIDSPLNAKIVQFSFNCRSGTKGWLWEAVLFFLQINYLVLMNTGWAGPPLLVFPPSMLGTIACEPVEKDCT
jgi:hypothetical protein